MFVLRCTVAFVFCQDDNYWAIKREKTAEELAAEAAAAAKKKEEEEQKKAEETVRSHTHTAARGFQDWASV